VVYRYKRPFRDGSTQVVWEPLDFMARLAALVPRPRLNLTRFHGLFAPHFRHRGRIVPRRSRRGINTKQPTEFDAVLGIRADSLIGHHAILRQYPADIICISYNVYIFVKSDIMCIHDPVGFPKSIVYSAGADLEANA
jgi:hypothetical protein